MKLTGLIPLYKYLKIKNENYASFEFLKNGVKFDILFDIFREPFKLILVQFKADYKLVLDVENGFVINPRLSKVEYRDLCKTLNLKYDPNNKFSPFSFFKELNDKIPAVPTFKPSTKQIYDYYKSEVEESEKIYYYGKIEWNKLPNSKGNVTEENLFKTRLLYPSLYEMCLRNNISIRYTDIKKDSKDPNIDFKGIE